LGYLLLSHEQVFTLNFVRTFIGSIGAKPIRNFGKSSRGCSQGLPKIFRSPHRAVIFAIAQLSCKYYYSQDSICVVSTCAGSLYDHFHCCWVCKCVCLSICGVVLLVCCHVVLYRRFTRHKATYTKWLMTIPYGTAGD